jgi:hypothetical protein
MKILSFIKDPEVIKKILKSRSKRDGISRPDLHPKPPQLHQIST